MSDADLTALVVMLRQIQCEPASFDTYSMASAAERAADAIERLRSPGGASDKFKGCVTCGSTEYPHDCNAPEPSERQPDGYAYRYPDGYIRFSGGREVNGSDPVETIPYYFRRAPEPGDELYRLLVVRGYAQHEASHIAGGPYPADDLALFALSVLTNASDATPATHPDTFRAAQEYADAWRSRPSSTKGDKP